MNSFEERLVEWTWIGIVAAIVGSLFSLEDLTIVGSCIAGTAFSALIMRRIVLSS